MPDHPARGTSAALLQDVVCGREVAETLHDFRAVSRYLTAPPSADGGRSYRLPTSTRSDWVILTVPNRGRPQVSRLTPAGATVRTFASDCSVDERSVARSTPPQEGAVGANRSEGRPARFTDADLGSALSAAAGRPVVVYVWSPHMPLSVDGFAEIQKAADRLGLSVEPVLIARGDADFARREAERVGMPASALREIDSVELVMRDAQVHAPSILVFGPDRVSPVLPGYRNSDGYGRYLTAFLTAG
ncbi:MAG: hypothetical protein O2956_01440 [Gemmatimonadetes bacterium]|nr:hypothetical protein [Gemmatimonadota bacterium]